MKTLQAALADLRARPYFRQRVPVVRSWPVSDPFPYDAVVSPAQFDAEWLAYYGSAMSDGERDVLARLLVQSEHFALGSRWGGALRRPGWGMAVRVVRGTPNILGYAQITDGQCCGYRANWRGEMYFEHAGRVYEIPTIVLTTKVRKRGSR